MLYKVMIVLTLKTQHKTNGSSSRNEFIYSFLNCDKVWSLYLHYVYSWLLLKGVVTLRGPPVGQGCRQWEIGVKGQDIQQACPRLALVEILPLKLPPILTIVHPFGVTLLFHTVFLLPVCSFTVCSLLSTLRVSATQLPLE